MAHRRDEPEVTRNRPQKTTGGKGKATPKRLKEMSAGERRQRVAALVGDPKTRAAIPTEYLPAEFRKKREFNQRLGQPFVPGGTSTYGDFLRERRAAAEQRFGPEQQELQRQQQQVPGWYDDYLRQLQGTQAATQAEYEKQRQAALSVGQAAAATAPGMEKDPEAIKAGQARQALAGSFAGSLGAQGASAFEQFGQMQAATKLRQGQRSQEIADKLRGLARERGDFYTTYTGERRQQELENAAVAKQFGLDVAKEEQKAQATSPEGRATVTSATEEAKQAQRHGMSVHQWRMLGPSGRKRRMKADKAKPADTVYSSGPFAGRRKSEIEGMSRGGRQTLIDRAERKKGAGSAGTKADRKKGRSDYNRALSLVEQQGGIQADNRQKYYDALVGKGTDPLAARAAVQVKGLGGVTHDVYKMMLKRYGIKLPRHKARKMPNVPQAPGAPGQGNRPT